MKPVWQLSGSLVQWKWMAYLFFTFEFRNTNNLNKTKQKGNLFPQELFEAWNKTTFQHIFIVRRIFATHSRKNLIKLCETNWNYLIRWKAIRKHWETHLWALSLLIFVACSHCFFSCVELAVSFLILTFKTMILFWARTHTHLKNTTVSCGLQRASHYTFLNYSLGVFCISGCFLDNFHLHIPLYFPTTIKTIVIFNKIQR